MKHDIIVIGAGHAGCEAALAAARMGCATMLLSISLDTIAQLSCNPAIGGLAKGQLAREVDALGGEMGNITDQAGIQFRELNSSKGPAVRSPRAQVDRRTYPLLMKHVLEETPNLSILQANAVAVEKDGDDFKVITLEKLTYTARAVIVTTGTFLNGLIHIGEFTQEAGRAGEFAAHGLTASLNALGLKSGRLKTGTPPRVNGRTLDLSCMEEQAGDDIVKPFGHYRAFKPYQQLPCWITYTNPQVHSIIADSLDRAPLYTGQIQSTGPRYCPSIETKIDRFPDNDRHQVFLEPEGRDTNEYYCNGISTSLPTDVQDDLVHAIAGMEKAEIVRYGYAIEYDFIFPYQLKRSMETRDIPGLFTAGQINGTSGYEEAAAQGLIAGINAVLKLRGEEPFVPGRHEAYIGVLIDDLVTKDIEEPYRMFTSLAEYRLRLRQDNADLRLAQYAHQFGLISDYTWQNLEQMRQRIEDTVEYCRNRYIDGKSLAAIICRPDMGLEDIEALDPDLKARELAGREREQVEIELIYSGYRDRQERMINKMAHKEHIRIPADIDYMAIREIKIEAREKLTRIKPETLGQAARIAGVSPADIAVLMVYMKAEDHSIPEETAAAD